jgi:hypothetical protein
MTLYISQDATYNLRQVVDIINSRSTQQLKINLYQNTDKVYSDERLDFQEITSFYNTNTFLPMFIAAPFAIMYYASPLVKLIVPALSLWGMYILSDDRALISHFFKYSPGLQSVLANNVKNEYSAIELTNLINILKNNSTYFSAPTFSEEAILKSFINHELQEIQPQLLSEQNSVDILHISWPYAVLNDLSLAEYA